MHAAIALIAKGAGAHSAHSSSAAASTSCCSQVKHCVSGAVYAGSAAAVGCAQAAGQAAADAMNGCCIASADCVNAVTGACANASHGCMQSICGQGYPCGDCFPQIGNCFQNFVVDLWYCDPCLNQQCGWWWLLRGQTVPSYDDPLHRPFLAGDDLDGEAQRLADDPWSNQLLDEFGQRQRVECFDELECQICAEEYTDVGGDHARAQLQRCGHVICKRCAEEERARRRRCPICRRLICLVDTNLMPPAKAVQERAPVQESITQLGSEAEGSARLGAHSAQAPAPVQNGQLRTEGPGADEMLPTPDGMCVK
mmetsp:Transcript_26770/g.49185  ORF Transcript_26770/g.49185 Transcript_26770/m.49185 type:complete len:311 (+) Transcript_26770:84-1016(+)